MPKISKDMQTVATSFTDLAGILTPAKQAKQQQPISDYEESRIRCIDIMIQLVRQSKIKFDFDIRRHVFTFEKPSSTKYNFKRYLWLEGCTWVFGDDGKQHARIADPNEMLDRVVRWLNSKLVKK